MPLNRDQIAQMIDFTAVAGGVGDEEMRQMCAEATKYPFASLCIFPCYVEMTRELLGEKCPDLCTVIGFPSGAHDPGIKAAETAWAVMQGCKEIDMVINVGAAISGRMDDCEDEMRSVVQAAQGKLVKVIIETHYLNDEQIKAASEAVVNAGAQFVKTSTGWAESGAKIEDVKLIKSVVGDRAQIKASGGIRTLEYMMELHEAGATRFGVGWGSALNILAEAGD
jgi:deoxyribose-phosphate aldolase